jgi:hypothetical protein
MSLIGDDWVSGSHGGGHNLLDGRDPELHDHGSDSPAAREEPE